MTDEELICSWMEPKPSGARMGRDVGHWWDWWNHPAEERWYPVDLTLDRLWEVEERLSSQQIDEYFAALLDLMEPPRMHQQLLHATAAQKIKALAVVLKKSLYEAAMSNRTKRLGRLGNAVVPAVAEWAGRQILESEKLL